MPLDVELGRDLAEKLTAQYAGTIKLIEFTYDDYVELDKLPKDPVVFVYPRMFDRERVARGIFQKNCMIGIDFVTAVTSTGDPAWIDRQIDSFDKMLDWVSQLSVGPGRTPVTIEQPDRYNQTMFKTHSRLAMRAELNYRNL